MDERDRIDDYIEELLAERDRYRVALEQIAALADPRRGHLAELGQRQMIARAALKGER